ncbi:MAG: MFS transporter [Spirochaetales bacterium]|uniref:MFS transporter n=1 Tax=Candidatus Thalassospirochaeta sargassi TaxID=3119039 RepID=A0AAJ1MNS3_9SPIO|nr:MFS transporter [Spirochaetales bacterium]
MEENSTQIRELKPRNYIAYGLGDLYGGGSFFLISTFSMYFLVSVVGMNPVLAGLIPGLGKIWDSISDPLMGYLTDNNKSRFGRRRVFFLIGIIPIMVTFTLIWLPVPFKSQISLFIYYFITYLMFYSCSTMVLVPYSALSAEMTNDFSKRNRLIGTRMVFSMAATLIGGVAAQPLINSFSSQSMGHLMMGLIFAIIFALPYILVFLGTWEIPIERKVKDERSSILKNFSSIYRNRTFRIHILMYICAYAAMDILMAWFKFYVIDYLKNPQVVTFGLGAILITQLIALPVYVRISNRRSHAFAYRTGLIIWALAIAALTIHQPGGSMLRLILNCVCIGAGMSAGVIIPFQLLPFDADVDELITTEKRAGTYAGAMTLIRKLIQGALVLPVLGLLLSLIGYQTSTDGEIIIQTAETMLRLRIIFITAPMLLAVTGILVSFRFPVTPKTHKILMNEIDRLKKGGDKSEVSPETKSVCEKLTGLDYMHLYKES